MVGGATVGGAIGGGRGADVAGSMGGGGGASVVARSIGGGGGKRGGFVRGSCDRPTLSVQHSSGSPFTFLLPQLRWDSIKKLTVFLELSDSNSLNNE